MTKRKNQFVGRYLIEHDPTREREPWGVYDVSHIFENTHEVFYCASEVEAKELAAKREALEGRRVKTERAV